MRKFKFIEPDFDSHTLEPIEFIMWEDEILIEFWPWWSEVMKRANRSKALITKENCITDWCIINFATEVLNEDYNN